jgi:CheY-like chemotaxis protein
LDHRRSRHDSGDALRGPTRRSIDRRITIETKLEAHPDQVKGDPALLEATLLNLAVNARDALPEGGQLTIQTNRISNEQDAKPAIQIRIADTGVGIPANVVDRVFEPCFTTKGVGKGTGLGLAAVYGTVRDHGGTVEVESDVGRGTTFTIRLPAASEPSERESSLSRSDNETSDGPYSILVIDDEKPVLDLVRSVLEGLGHRVLSTHDVDEGPAIYEECRKTIDIVVLDLVMPKMSGQQVLERIRQRDEDIPVVLTSGYAGDTLAELLKHSNVRFLQKPYGRDDLASMVRDIAKT